MNEILNPIDGSALLGAKSLFVIGCPRSGTTLVARVLNAHPSVLMTNETAVFLMMADQIAKSRVGIESGLLYGKEYYRLWSDHLKEQAGTLIESYYEKICRAEGKTRVAYWGEKHPHLADCLDFVSWLYPNSRYIYIVRDPRDVACSVSALIGVEKGAAMQALKPAVDSYENFVKRLEPQRLLRIRYRDLIQDYAWMAGHIFSWLELEYSSDTRAAVMRWQSRDSHFAVAEESPQIDFAAKSIGRWRREFSESEASLAEELFGQYLRNYRYTV